MSISPYPKVHLLSQGEAGDTSLVEALGIDVVVLCDQGMVWSHSAAAEAGALNLRRDGTTATWWLRFWSDQLADQYGVKTIGLADKNGGLGTAAFLLACAVAQKQGSSFAAAWADVQTKIPSDEGHRVPDALVSQGESIWV